MNLKVKLEYDGSAYHGWQRQKNARSVQEVVERAIIRISGEEIVVIGAGRTDAGVHAKEQVINFHTKMRIPIEKIPYAINSQLPEDIVAYEAEVVADSFHARFCAKSKIYNYTIYNAPYPSPILRKYAYFSPKPLDINAMREASHEFIGTHDFSAFKASGSPVKNSVRHVKMLEVLEKDNIIFIKIEADGFLYNMTRIIAGTLLDVGLGKIAPHQIFPIIESKDRSRAGKTLPPHGLCLERIIY
ncbi:MAG: tRNA pseudouridine(38-40) synthase TruA [Thermoanaerobacterales bacterium]|nr:tRNA pseudouridine(38-40) synthase TruA [Thermoanaerobacterales bacterium]